MSDSVKEQNPFSFNFFSELHDGYMSMKSKPAKNKYVKWVYYIIYIIILFFFSMTLVLFNSKLNNKEKKSYRNSTKYPKVIKEGLFFDTIEYHER